MKKDAITFLQHIRESIALIEEYTKGVGEDAFSESSGIQDQVVRRLEIIGEAVKNLPNDFRAAHPEVRWKEVAGMRDKLIHAYFSVDLELLWVVIKDDLPALKKDIEKLLHEGAQK